MGNKEKKLPPPKPNATPDGHLSFEIKFHFKYKRIE